jgi:SAM-dependent methyltransferase
MIGTENGGRSVRTVLLPPSFSDEKMMSLLKRLGFPDPQGELNALRRGERSLVGICMRLLLTGGTLSDGAFINGAYRSLLGREPDDGGFRGCLAGLASASMCRADVIYSILHSQEFQEQLGTTRRFSGGPARNLARLRLYLAGHSQRTFRARPLLPPLLMRRRVGEKLWDISGRGFEITGWRFVEKLLQDAGLTPGVRMLDLGSGCGRTAIPLTETIGPRGLYRGLEPARTMVEWCQRRITPRFPHFHFVHFDARNKVYNPRGREEPEGFRLPFEENSFDLVVAISVFTHLLPDATLKYVRECSRVLSCRGILFATFFLAESGLRSADGRLRFIHPLEGMALSVDRKFPEKAVSYHAKWLLDVGQKSMLELAPPIRWGGWSGRSPAYSFQDVLIFRKR